jgi:hypothetical protein
MILSRPYKILNFELSSHKIRPELTRINHMNSLKILTKLIVVLLLNWKLLPLKLKDFLINLPGSLESDL